MNGEEGRESLHIIVLRTALIDVVTTDPGEGACSILPQVGILVFGDFKDGEVGVGGLQRT